MDLSDLTELRCIVAAALSIDVELVTLNLCGTEELPIWEVWTRGGFTGQGTTPVEAVRATIEDYVGGDPEEASDE